MKEDIYMISTYPDRKCGVGTFAANFVDSIAKNVNSIKIAAIENPKEHNNYVFPAVNDWIINQYNPNSWKAVGHEICSEILKKTNKKDSTIILQHEYGLDPSDKGEPGLGHNYVDLAKMFKNEGIRVITQLHTVEKRPSENKTHRVKTLQELAQYSNSILVIANKAIDILSSSTYNISPEIIEHIPHGTRNFLNGEGRDQTKERYGLEGKLVFTTIGMKGYPKGIDRSILSWGKFLDKDCTEEQRKKMVYIVAGGYHPSFVSKNQGKDLQEYKNFIEKIVKNSKITSTTTKNVKELGKLANENNLIFLEPSEGSAYVSEKFYIDSFKMTNGVVLLYRTEDQISSGPLSDAIGSGRATIASKFLYSQEMLNPGKRDQKGIIGIEELEARGLLVDQDEIECIEQTVKCFNHLVFNQVARSKMENIAAKEGSKMEWPTIGQRFLEHLDYLKRTEDHKEGKDPIFIKQN